MEKEKLPFAVPLMITDEFAIENYNAGPSSPLQDEWETDEEGFT